MTKAHSTGLAILLVSRPCARLPTTGPVGCPSSAAEANLWEPGVHEHRGPVCCPP